MNLFDNIIQTSKNNFLGTKPIVPSTPSFTTPQAPRTSSYIAPNTPYSPSKPSMSLFSDEKQMFQKMKADNLSDDTAYSMLKKRRMDILGGNDLANDEKSMLLKMQAGNVPVKQAVEMIKERRKDQFNKKYEEGNLLQKGAYNTLAFAAGNLETLAKYSGNTLDFITGGTMGFGDEVNKMEQVTSSPEFSESSAFTAGTYLPDVALAVSPVGGQYLAGAKGMTGLQGANLFSKIGAKNLTQGLMGRSAVVGAGFGATQPIFEKGSDATMEDIATGASVGGALGAVATPVIGKALKYGQAGYRGGLTGMGKSITRDIKSGVNAITPSGANISTKANRFNANEIREFTKRTGQSPGDFATSRGMTKVGDDAVVEATNLWKASKDQADEALQAIKGRFRFTDEGEDLLKTTIDDLETRLVNTKSPDYKRISQLKAKYEDTGLTMSEINEIKRAYSNNYKYSFVDAGSESALRSRNLQDAVRNWQFKVAEENGLTNLKEINKTTQGWKMFADSLSKKIQGSSGNNNVSLTDWIALSGGSPENIALYLGKKLASSDTVKSGAIKLFSKKTKPSIIQASKADIQQANFKKDVNRGVSGVGDNSGGKSMVRPVGLIEAPKGQATGAKNVRVNQPIEKSPIKNEGQVGVRPGTKANIKTPEEVQLAKQTQRQEQFRQVERDLNTALLSKYNPNKPKATKEFLDRAITQGKITKEEAITLVENLYEKADGWNKPHYERMLNDLYSNKKIESWDDLLNEKQVKTVIKTPRQEFLETPEGIYREIQKKANDRRYNPDKADALIAKFKEKTGIDLMTEKTPNFDKDGNVVKVIKKLTPNTIKNESTAKSKKLNTNASDTIPEGYFKNAFGEIQKNPSNKTGGFIRNPFAKIEPKRLFAGENSAQPPKGKTGWFKGADGKMRFEIDDSSAKINPTLNPPKGRTEVALKDILIHDDLYKQYPEIGDIRVRLNIEDYNNMGGGQLGDRIALNTKDLQNKKTLSVLLHEIQHSIQDIEGFAKGASMQGRVERIMSEAIESVKKNPSIFNKIYQDIRVSLAKKEFAKNTPEQNGANIESDYMKSGGEVESRNVEKRMDMTMEERLTNPPKSTEDVPRSKQIIRMDSKGTSMSIPNIGKKGIPVKIPEIGKKVDIETNNFEKFTSKFKSFEEFKNAVKVIDSRDISNREGNRITRMVGTKNGEFDSLDSFIENYSSEFPYWRSGFEKNSVNAIKKAMNDEYITVYRALPKGKSIEGGDWIALTKEYAEAHLGNMEKGNGVIISIKVPKKDVFNAYTDPNEWLYAPQNKLNGINSLEDFYKQYSNKTKTIVKPESKSIVKNPGDMETKKLIPKEVYHGTDYDGVKIVPNNNPYKNQWGDVIYMTGDKKIANSYGKNVYKSSTEGKKFFDLNKKLTNRDIEEIGNNLPENQRKDFIREFTSSLSSTPREGKYIYQYFQYKTKLGRNYINEVLKKMGYDGVYGYGNDEALGKIYGIFNTKNISK